jgi:regulator of protease activity HflC (stomatin/prohibitin superfamily)
MTTFNRITIGLMIVVAAILAAVGCTTVEPGYVGIKVNQYGTQKGVEDYPIFTGRQGYNPFTETVYQWPTYTQRIVWDGVHGDEDTVDNSITVRAAKGVSVNLDIALAYRLEPKKVPEIFVTYRQDIESLSNGYLRDTVRDVFQNHSAKMDVMDLLGPGMQQLTDNVQVELKEKLGPRGFVIDGVSIVGRPRIDKSIETAINNVLQASQNADRAEQEIRSVEAQAKKRLIEAQAQADAILAEAKAQAEANKIIADSLNQYGDKVLESKALDKWNGALPQFQTSGATPFINIHPKQ